MFKSISIKVFILSILIGLGITTTIISSISGVEIQKAALLAEEKTLSNIIRVAVNESVNTLRENVSKLARNLISDKDSVKHLKNIIKNKSVSTAEEVAALNAQFHQRFNTAGIVQIKKIRLYNKQLDLVGVSTEGAENLTDAMPEKLFQRAKKRKGAKRLKAIDQVWARDGNVYFSTLLPVGGFRLKGYVELVLDLPYNLKRVEKTLDMPIKIISAKNESLYVSDTWLTLDNEAKKDVNIVSYKMMYEDALLLTIQAEVDISEFKNATSQVQWTFTVIFMAVALFFILASLYILNRYLFKPLNKTVYSIEDFSHGNVDAEFESSGLIELRVIGSALSVMQQQVKTRIVETEKLLEDNLKVKKALDNASASVMLADETNVVIYANVSSENLFKTYKDVFQSQADLNIDSVKGLSLSKLGSKINALLRSPNHSQKENFTIELDGLYWEVVTVPVVSNGHYVATIIELNDRTAEKSIELEVSHVVEKLKHGDLSQRLSLEDKSGFFLQLSEAINDMVDEISSSLNSVAMVMSSMAEGDLSKTIDGQFEGMYEQIKNDVNSNIQNLNNVVGQIIESSGYIREKSREISAGNASLSRRVEDQSSALEETAASMEELTSTVKNNAQNASQASELAAAASQVAVKGGDTVAKAVSAMEGIQSSSSKISEIIGVIDEIAFQTNLLALNASVEAARAGEQGRGFAVVATEVRNLAQRSATAAKEIKELIVESVNKVEVGSELVNTSGENLVDIVSSVQKVADIISEIAMASKEQSQGIEQVNLAVTHMDELTQQNAALAEEASASSEATLTHAEKMSEIVAFFKSSR